MLLVTALFSASTTHYFNTFDMSRPYLNVEKKVKKAIGTMAFNFIVKYVESHKPDLWSDQKPRAFFKKATILSLYKDLSGKGYTKISKSVNMGFKYTHKSFRHNTQVLRGVLAEWAKKFLQFGSLEDWTKEMRDVDINLKHLDGACLWMDSTDFKKVKYKGWSKKNPDWSYKENSPGRRYMIIRDGKGRIRKIWGGYSPKIHDGNFLELWREWIEENLAGAGVIADEHFGWGKQHLKEVKYYTPIRRPPSKKRTYDGEDIAKLTKNEEAYNEAIHSARARVENPFAQLKKKWVALGSPWAEEDEQLDHLIRVAIAIYNLQNN